MIGGRPVGYSKDFGYNPPVQERVANGNVTILSLSLAKEVLKVNLPTDEPAEGEMIYAVGHLQYILAYVAESEKHTVRNLLSDRVEENGKTLEEKTLVVDKADLKKGVTEEEVTKAYPFPVKLMEMQEIDKLFVDKASGYAVLKVIPVEIGNGGMTAHVIAGTEDGKFYYFDYNKVMRMNGIKFGRADLLKESNFRDLARAVEKK
jgi:hypothetical protein